MHPLPHADRWDWGLTSIVVAVTDQLAAGGLEGSVDAPQPGDAATIDADPLTTDSAADGSVDQASTWRRRRQRPPRINRWDRPPDPHDWRFFVGNLGKVLIATGLLMFGFVAYQLWGTGIEYAAAQNSLENQFEQLIAQNLPDNPSADNPSADNPSADPPGVADNPSADPPGVAEGTAEAPQTDSDPPTETAADIVDAESATVDAADTGIPVAVDLSDQAVEKEPLVVRRGDVLARLDIPRIHDGPLYVVPGVKLSDLKDGPGHYPDTPLPGQLGNASIAGHRTTYGQPFFDVDQLVAGDEIVVTMVNGDRFVYLVTFTEIVSASDYWVVTTRDPNVAELTLTSCHPKYTARDRIVVHSVLDPVRSSNIGVATFYDLEPVDAEPIPGDDPVLVADAPAGDDPVQIDPSGDADVEPPIDDASSFRVSAYSPKTKSDNPSQRKSTTTCTSVLTAGTSKPRSKLNITLRSVRRWTQSFEILLRFNSYDSCSACSGKTNASNR